MARACVLSAIAGACLVVVARGHSWVACTDYRGDVNFFEQENCVAWPRQYQPMLRPKGYQIAEPESRAWANGGCDRPMTTPDWRLGYSAAFPHAIYEPGRVYCLAWPMKNHATTPEQCMNPHAKSDAGTDETLRLLVSVLSLAHDPDQAEFNQRNINELAGLASNCSHIWRERGEPGSSELTDDCQLGLEKHRTGEIDCKGFQRAPKFCENTGAAMGTGCFKVPDDMTAGHYVAQWHWEASFEGRGRFAYTTCFDFEVVASGSSAARSGTPGTVGTPESPGLPCRNNVHKFAGAGSGESAGPQHAPSAAPTTLAGPQPAPALTTTPASTCSSPYQICAGPDRPGPFCCTQGYACVFQNADWAQCVPVSPTSGPLAPTRAPTTSSTAPSPAGPCSAPYHVCASPSGTSAGCCTQGYECTFQNAHWAQCRPLAGLMEAKWSERREVVERNVTKKATSAPGPPSVSRHRRKQSGGFLSQENAFVQVGKTLTPPNFGQHADEF
mmetsp:Transcript_21099/g.58966  ORF Transcript_21099/g.58966 Transcript_21099/m.58966 type:complete len:499 (-) Transcript_21099:143-1639(-)